MRGKVKIEYAGEFAGIASAAALIETKLATKAEPPKPVQLPESSIEKDVHGIR